MNLRQTLQTASQSTGFPYSTQQKFKLANINEEFVKKSLKGIKTTKSTGIENIPARLIKDGAEELAQPLTLLMNRSIDEGSIPFEWKHALVTPVYKSGKKSDPTNYRPISVLPIFMKIMERSIHQTIYTYLQENNLLSNLQSGFRPLHSTTTSLIDMTNRVLHNMDRGLLTGMAFLDLSKAFDTLDHHLMIKKLSSLGFSNSALVWMDAYLTNRTQSIVSNGVVSDPQPIHFGIPQGSILGPLLFIIYINDLPSVIKDCSIQLYADDTVISFSSKSVSEIESRLSSDLDNIISWLDENFLFLNYSKTKIMMFGTHQRLAKVNDFTITARDSLFERVYQFKYLGVMLDPCLSWNDHIDYIASKISSRIGMLRKARKVIPREACITLYDAMILPIFDYCCAVWDSCGKTNKGYLDKLQRRAARVIVGCKYRDKVNICSVFSWPSLESRRSYQICLQVHKCLNNLAPAYLLNESRFSSDIHNYNTRNKDSLRLPLARTTKYQSSFRFNAAKTWNSLPLVIRKESNIIKFKKALKRHLKKS